MVLIIHKAGEIHCDAEWLQSQRSGRKHLQAWQALPKHSVAGVLDGGSQATGCPAVVPTGQVQAVICRRCLGAICQPPLCLVELPFLCEPTAAHSLIAGAHTTNFGNLEVLAAY